MTAASGASRHADALVLFGGTGDLAFKKIFPALQSLAKLGALNLPVLAVTRGLRDKQALLARMRESINKHGDGVDEDVFRDLSNRLQVVPDESGEASTYRLLKETLAGSVRPLFYLAIPPSAYPSVVNALALADCAHGGRLLIEKPFGHDLSSSRALDGAIHRVFDEARVFRLDHYAGKLSVQNVLLFRFANSFAAALWDRHHVSSVKITMAEAFGVAGRGAFYEEVGAVRDVLQNHLLLVAGLVAMEPPTGSHPERLRDELV